MPPIELPLLFRIITGFLLVMQTLSRLWMTRNKPLSENSRFSHRSREHFSFV
jgi:hypothetical protein